MEHRIFEAPNGELTIAHSEFQAEIYVAEGFIEVQESESKKKK